MRFYRSRVTYAEKRKASLVIAPFALFSLFIALTALSPHTTTLEKADPFVLKAIQNNEDFYATVVGERISVSNALREWHFGDLSIYYTRISAEEAKRLLQDERLLYIYGWGVVSLSDHREQTKVYLPPHSFKTSELYPFDPKIDAKRYIHLANQLYTGKGVTIAVIDTGVDYLHEDLFYADRTVLKALVSTIYKDSSGKPLEINVVDATKSELEQILQLYDLPKVAEKKDLIFQDMNGHGTHVIGIIAGQGNINPLYRGIATGARVISIKAFYDKGYATEETILDALQWIYDNAEKYDIKVVSGSFGSASGSKKPTPTELAVRKISSEKSIVFFFASGNAGAILGTVLSPSRDYSCFSVGAIDPYTGELAIFSSVGEPYPPIAPQDWIKPDFVGAGVNVISLRTRFLEGDPYLVASGTSMATPSVAGVYACFYEFFLEKYGRYPTKEDFITFVRNYGLTYNPLWKDFITGYGLPQCPR
ncbi:MAG: S8 family serine peptidase [Archaeoglobaceae archaeon]